MISRVLLAVAASVAAATASCPTGGCQPGPCHAQAFCVQDQCLYAPSPDGISCNGGANTCEKGSCTGQSAVQVKRRAADEQPSIDTEDGKIVISAKEVAFSAKDVTFNIAETAGTAGQEYVAARSISIVTLKDELESSIESLATEINDTVETEIQSIKTDLSTLETNVNTKVAADINTVTDTVTALEKQVKEDVATELKAASDNIEDLVKATTDTNEEQDSTIKENSDQITALKARFEFPQIFSQGTAIAAIDLIAAGDQQIIFSGANFNKGTKVQFGYDGKFVDAKGVGLDKDGTWVRIITPTFTPKDSICAGGKGVDTPAKIRIYGTGAASEKYIERSATIKNVVSDFGDARDGDMVVDKPRYWNSGLFGGAYHVKSNFLLGEKENKWDAGKQEVVVKKIRTYRQMPEDHFKCGQTILVMNMGHKDRQTEHQGAYFMCEVQDHTNDGGGGIVTCRVPMTLRLMRKQTDQNIILQRVPHYNHLQFKGLGSFLAKRLNYEASGAYGASYVTHTGIVAFLAQKVTVDTANAAVNVHQLGYRGGKRSGQLAQDARKAGISGGRDGQNANPAGCGHNRRGGYGGHGCPTGEAGAGGNTGGGYAYGGYQGGNNHQGGGGGGGADYSCTGAGGAGAHCSGGMYSKRHVGTFKSGGHTLIHGGGAAAGGGGGSSEGRGGKATGAGGSGGNGGGGHGGDGGGGGGIALVGVGELNFYRGVFIDAAGGRGGSGGGGTGGGHKDGGGGGGQGANGASGGAVVVRSGDGKVTVNMITVAGGGGGGGGGGAGVPNQHNPSASGGGGAGAGEGGGGGGGTRNSGTGGKGGQGADGYGKGVTRGQYDSGGKASGGGGGCTGGCAGRGGEANKGGYSSSTSCNRGADASGNNGGNGGNGNGCGSDGNRAGGGGGAGAGAKGADGYLAIV